MSSIKVNKSNICLHVLPYYPKDIIRKGQFALDELPLKKVKEFIRALFNSDIKGAITWFDKLDCNISIKREPDRDMNLDKFLSQLTKGRYLIRLQIGDPSNEQIRFSVRNFPRDCAADCFAWFECDLTPENYKKLDDEFEKAFGFRIKELC